MQSNLNMNEEITEAIRKLGELLKKHNISVKRFVVDVEEQVIEQAETDEYSVTDILSGVGMLDKERFNELRAEVRKSREEWD